MSSKILNVLGLVTTIISLAATLAGKIIGDKQQEATIANEVAKALGKTN